MKIWTWLKSLFNRVLSVFVRRKSRTEGLNGAGDLSRMIASPVVANTKRSFPDVIAVPRNVAKAVVNCCRKGRYDLAEAVLRGQGYGETKITVTEKEIVAETGVGLVILDPSSYPEA
jgi:hypothetical protein